jgi:hypothetical protein
MNPGLHAALDVHHGCRRVDPPGGHKHHRGKRPKKRHTDDKPSEKGSKKSLPERSLGLCVWPFSHISVYAGVETPAYRPQCADLYSSIL